MRRVSSRILAGLCAALLALAGPAQAQVVTTGSLEVIVEDESGGRLPGATVMAQSTDSISRREATTDHEGRALLQPLEPSAQYALTASLTGFGTVKRERLLVRSGQVTTVRVSLKLGQVAEEIVVTAETPVVDVTSATTGQDITLELTESLPTGRSYQSYLQLVPGVLPDDNTRPGNPASKSGLNYADIRGEIGISRDNFYYIDGINVTDGVTGTFGANLNTEIIQEQKVLTGGIPAEFVGTPGLLSNVVTKSGSNTFHGSVNYFFQNDALVAENENAPDQNFSNFDTALTLGGPLVKGRAWFFGSYRRLQREDDVTALDTGELLRTVKSEQDQFYGRVTWAPTRNDILSLTFLNDPTDISGENQRTITNARDFSQVQGGDRWGAKYTRLFGPVNVDLSYNKHNGEVSRFSAIRQAQNNVIFRRADARSLADEQLGGFGQDLIDERDSELYRAAFRWEVDRHSIRGGAEFQKNRNFRNTTFIGQAIYSSLSSGLLGISAGELGTGSFSAREFSPFNTSDFEGLIRFGINASPNRAAIIASLDLNGDGALTPQEVGQALRFSSTAGNPDGRINFQRDFQSAEGPQDLGSEGLSFFLQDTVRLGRLTVNAGLRTERFEHFATTGESIFTFDWTFAPRVSAIYDLFADGRHKLSAYYGKYYDPIRNNLTQFAGTLTGSVLEEQVFVNGEWLTYRIRGGPVQQDAFFAPTTKTPFTDDLQFSYQVDLGRSMSLEATYTKRRTRDIIEDYDLSLYASSVDGDTAYPGPIDHPDSLFLGLDYFGYERNPGSNFVIATLDGGKRDYQGVELVFRKRYSNNWQALASYTFNDAEGNTNSDSNADFQGDEIILDPRAPNQFGRQPGSIRHLAKIAASYRFRFGLEFGGTFRWNTGPADSRTFLAALRHLPVFVSEPFEFAGITNTWVAPGAIGGVENPSNALFDLRVQYVRSFDKIRGEFFVDVFNVFNDQDATRNQDLVAGQGGIEFGEPVLFNTPRRFFLGARLSF